MKSFETIKFEKQGAIGVLTMNRPEALNALNSQVISELAEFLKLIDQDREVRCLVVTGEGKAFVAGADIKEMQNYNQDQALEMSENGQKVMQAFQDLSIPSIAAVNGFALGGGLELALACDVILASDKAKLGLPEVSLGLIPGYGGTQRLARTIGKGRARLMTLTGDIYSAQQCYDWGLISEVYASEEFNSKVLEVANKIASRAPVALDLARQAINLGFDRSLAEGLSLEAELFSKTFTTQDKVEGVNAFIEKRKPEFKGQ